MRLACTLVLCMLLSPVHAQEKPKPKVLDWKDIPLSADTDLAEKVKRIKAEYEGKQVVATGIVRGPFGEGQQDVVFTIVQPTRRGELILDQRVRVRMWQVQPKRIHALVDRRVTVVGTGKQDSDPYGARLMLDKARFVTGKAELRKKP